jgi:hypothetical protein
VHVVITKVVPNPLRADLEGELMLGDLAVSDCVPAIVPTAADKTANQTDPEVLCVLAFLADHVVVRHALLFPDADLAL